MSTRTSRPPAPRRRACREHTLNERGIVIAFRVVVKARQAASDFATRSYPSRSGKHGEGFLQLAHRVRRQLGNAALVEAHQTPGDDLGKLFGALLAGRRLGAAPPHGQTTQLEERIAVDGSRRVVPGVCQLMQRPAPVDATELDGAVANLVQRRLSVAQHGKRDLHIRELQTSVAEPVHRPRHDRPRLRSRLVEVGDPRLTPWRWRTRTVLSALGRGHGASSNKVLSRSSAV